MKLKFPSPEDPFTIATASTSGYSKGLFKHVRKYSLAKPSTKLKDYCSTANKNNVAPNVVPRILVSNNHAFAGGVQGKNCIQPLPNRIPSLNRTIYHNKHFSETQKCNLIVNKENKAGTAQFITIPTLEPMFSRYKTASVQCGPPPIIERARQTLTRSFNKSKHCSGTRMEYKFFKVPELFQLFSGRILLKTRLFFGQVHCPSREVRSTHNANTF